jgi:uncharacterized protein YndB with AHSA1/START domain
MTPRVDKVSRFAAAPPERIFLALLDPEQLADGLPPTGMSARIVRFEPHEGGLCPLTRGAAIPHLSEAQSS